MKYNLLRALCLMLLQWLLMLSVGVLTDRLLCWGYDGMKETETGAESDYNI